jgi:hypothetical protein
MRGDPTAALPRQPTLDKPKSDLSTRISAKPHSKALSATISGDVIYVRG